MSTYEKIMGLAIRDNEFRTALFVNPYKACRDRDIELSERDAKLIETGVDAALAAGKFSVMSATVLFFWGGNGKGSN